jgi:hypothetical protein
MGRTVGARVRNSAGTAKRAKAWQAMRILRRFTLPQVEMSAEIGESNLQRFVRALTRSGFLRLDRARRPGIPASCNVYRLVRDTGPKAPILGNDGFVYDENTRTLYPTAPDNAGAPTHDQPGARQMNATTSTLLSPESFRVCTETMHKLSWGSIEYERLTEDFHRLTGVSWLQHNITPGQGVRATRIRLFLLLTANVSAPAGVYQEALRTVIQASYPDATLEEVQQELAFLESAGMVKMHRDGANRWVVELPYEINPPKELFDLMSK